MYPPPPPPHFRFERDYSTTKHGGVVVRYKNALTDQADMQHDEWKPFDLNAETGRHVTKSEGLQFMMNWPDTSSNPGLETLKPPEAWSFDQVKKGVLRTAEQHKFTSAHKADWRALFDFLERHSTSESMPELPTAMPLDDGRPAHVLNGAPVAWDEMWSLFLNHAKEAGAAKDKAAAEPTFSASSLTPAPQPRPATLPPLPPLPLAMVNVLTGINAPRKERDEAIREHRANVALATMPLSAPREDLRRGDLYFGELDDYEGEFRVGLFRLEAIDDERKTAEVSWYYRKAYNPERPRRNHAWSDTATFHPFLEKDKSVSKGYAFPLEAILPVQVVQTKESQKDWDGSVESARSIQDTKVRLAKECVTQLREFIKARKPHLRIDDTTLAHEVEEMQKKRKQQQQEVQLEKSKARKQAALLKQAQRRVQPRRDQQNEEEEGDDDDDYEEDNISNDDDDGDDDSNGDYGDDDDGGGKDDDDGGCGGEDDDDDDDDDDEQRHSRRWSRGGYRSST